MNLISLDDGTLAVAAAIEPHIGSLDAIHLAAGSLLGFDTTVVTHDAQVHDVARHLGLATCDPMGN